MPAYPEPINPIARELSLITKIQTILDKRTALRSWSLGDRVLLRALINDLTESDFTPKGGAKDSPASPLPWPRSLTRIPATATTHDKISINTDEFITFVHNLSSVLTTNPTSDGRGNSCDPDYPDACPHCGVRLDPTTRHCPDCHS